MNKRKTAVLIILFTFLLSIFVSACDTNKTGSETEVSSQPTEQGLPYVGKFVVAVPKTSDTDYSLGNEITKQKIIESIASEKGVTIDFEVIELSADNFTNELNQLLSSATNIDAITTDYSALEMYTTVPGLIQPIDSLLADSGTNLYNAIDESYWEDVKYDGQIYGVPSMPYPEKSFLVARSDMIYMFTTESIDSFASLLALCKFFKTLGYEYPIAATWDQLIDIFAIPFNAPAEPYTMDAGNKAFYMREQTSGYSDTFMEQMKLLYEEGYLNPNVFGGTPDQMKAEFLAGRSAIYVAESDDVFSDRAMLKSAFPDAEMKLISPLRTIQHQTKYLSGETKIDKVLMFTANGQNNKALMVYLDWAYTSQLNHTMTELGAYGDFVLYNPALNEYEYVGDYTKDSVPYGGIYTLGLSTEMLYTPPTQREYTIDIIAQNTLMNDIHKYLTETESINGFTIQLTQSAQTALDEYTQIMRSAAEWYIRGEIDIDQYAQYERDTRNSGLAGRLAQEIGVPYLYARGVLD